MPSPVPHPDASLPWSQLVHWHGRAEQVPTQIEALWHPQAAARREAAHTLARVLEHQDGVMQATPFAVQRMLTCWRNRAATGSPPPSDGLMAVLAPIATAITFQQLGRGPKPGPWG